MLKQKHVEHTHPDHAIKDHQFSFTQSAAASCLIFLEWNNSFKLMQVDKTLHKELRIG